MSNIVRIDKKKKNKIADDMLDYMQGFDFNEDWGIRKQPLSSDLKYYKSRVLANMYNFSLSTNKFMKFFYASRLHFIIILEIHQLFNFHDLYASNLCILNILIFSNRSFYKGIRLFLQNGFSKKDIDFGLLQTFTNYTVMNNI